MNLRMEEKKAGQDLVLKFALTESPVMLRTYGSTTLTPIDHGKKTHFKYQITIRPKGYLPVGAPLERRMKEAIPERLIATAKRVELRDRDALVLSSDDSDGRRSFSNFWHRRAA